MKGLKTYGLGIVLISMFALSLGLLNPIQGATSGTATVTTTVSSVAPTITYVGNPGTITPTEGGTVTVTFDVHVTDDNGVSDITLVNATLNITGSERTDTSCVDNGDIDATTANFTCSVDLYYYDNPGTWTIYAYAEDAGGNNDWNSSVTFTYNSLSAMTLVDNSIIFGTVNPGTNDNPATENPYELNNTGNVDFSTINITALDLVGVTDNSYSIGAGNFTVNTINDAAGDQLINNTAVTITGASLSHGAEPSLEDLYYFMDVPAGTASQDYNTNANGAWTIEAIV